MNKKLFFVASSALLLGVSALAGCTGAPKNKAYSEYLGKSVDELKQEVLGDYNTKYLKAAAITDPAKTQERYEAFAEAEYSLIYDEAIIVPWLTASGYSASVSKTVPWQAGRASYGLTGDKFKNVVLTNKPAGGASAITKEERKTITDAYNAGKLTQQAPAVDADGFISLANLNSNPELDANGNYAVPGTDLVFPTKDEFHTTISKDYQTMNYLTSQWTYNSYHFCNMVDGLVENDKYGNIVGAIATAYKSEVNSDGDQVITFKLRDDAKWVNNADGSVYGNVVADDFVASAEYVLNPDNGSATSSILFTVKGAKAYYNGESFSKEAFAAAVGVKAVDEHTLQYTLDGEVPYFLSSLTYAPFLPVSRQFLADKGTDFGNSENDILANGAFRITKHVAGSAPEFEYSRNEQYYDVKHVYLKKITRISAPAAAPTSWARTQYEAGNIDSFTVSASDEEGQAKYVTGDDEANPGTIKNPAHPECNGILSVGDATYIGYFNVNRDYFEVNDKKNKKSETQKVATANALSNKDFRKGVLYGLDVSYFLYLYQLDEWYNYLMRGYTNRELASVNGRDYADLVDDVYNEKQGLTGDNKVTLTGINNADLHPVTEANPTAPDPVYSIEKARQYFASAKAALLAKGLTEKDFPIKVDIIAEMSSTIFAYQQYMFKAMEDDEEIGKIVDFVFNTPSSEEQDTDWGSVSNNYDFSMWSGWGPDYADPNTFLHTYAMEDGDMLVNLGF